MEFTTVNDLRLRDAKAMFRTIASKSKFIMDGEKDAINRFTHAIDNWLNQ